MGDLWLWFVVHLPSSQSSLLCERDEGTEERGREKKERRVKRTASRSLSGCLPFVRQPGVPQIAGNDYLGAVSETLHEMNETAFPVWPGPLHPAALTSHQPDLAHVAVGLRLSQQLSFVDFPSSKRFCSPAGQLRPQHARLQTAAAPHSSSSLGGKAGIHYRNSQTLSLSGLDVW